jgi:hypothetical protein
MGQRGLDQPQGYGLAPGGPGQYGKPEIKAIAMAGTGIINGQIPSGTQGKPYYGAGGNG